jgi:hypothetical protein
MLDPSVGQRGPPTACRFHVMHRTGLCSRVATGIAVVELDGHVVSETAIVTVWFGAAARTACRPQAVATPPSSVLLDVRVSRAGSEVDRRIGGDRGGDPGSNFRGLAWWAQQLPELLRRSRVLSTYFAVQSLVSVCSRVREGLAKI